MMKKVLGFFGAMFGYSHDEGLSELDAVMPELNILTKTLRDLEAETRNLTTLSGDHLIRLIEAVASWNGSTKTLQEIEGTIRRHKSRLQYREGIVRALHQTVFWIELARSPDKNERVLSNPDFTLRSLCKNLQDLDRFLASTRMQSVA